VSVIQPLARRPSTKIHIEAPALLQFLIPVGSILAIGLYFYLFAYVSELLAGVILVSLAVFSFLFMPRFALCLIFASSLFQLFWLAVMMDGIDSYDKYLRAGSTFVVNIVFVGSFLYLASRWRFLSPDLKKTLKMAAAFVVLAICYAVIGTFRQSFGSAFTYLKCYSAGFTFLVIGVVMGLRLGIDAIIRVFIHFAVILVLYGIVEMTFSEELYSFMHLADYYTMKLTKMGYPDLKFRFYGIGVVIDYLQVPYLNLTGDFSFRDAKMLRITGPLLHFISYAYSLAFCGLVALMAKRYLIGFSAIVMIFIIGSKGALMLVFFTLMAWGLYKLTGRMGPSRKILQIALMIYVPLVMAYGLTSYDPHILGLMAGIKGTITNPIGHGVGVGGIMSDTKRDAALSGNFVMGGAQAVDTLEFAVESAIGVLMYQMGVPGLLMFLAFWRHVIGRMYQAAALKLKTDAGATSLITILPLALTVLLVNGLFQEEVVTSVCWGFWMLLAGTVLGRMENEWAASKRASPVAATNQSKELAACPA
jgi:hypothetical protein